MGKEEEERGGRWEGGGLIPAIMRAGDADQVEEGRMCVCVRVCVYVAVTSGR